MSGMIRMIASSLVVCFLVVAVPSARADFFPLSTDPNGEPSLQTIFNNTYGTNGWSQLPSGQKIWTSPSSGLVSYQLIASYAADSHLFGYSTTTGSPIGLGNFQPLFSVTGSVYSRTVNPSGTGTVTLPAGTPFVWVLDNTSTGNYLSSNDSQNSGVDPTMPEHMLTFGINGNPNEFVIAFEDLTVGEGTDRDYNDLVVQVTLVPGEGGSPNPVPEPISLVLFGLGAGLMAASEWRRRRTARPAALQTL